MFAALLLSLTAQDGCPTGHIDPIEQPQPMQKAGDGLWIGGIQFLSGDIETAEPRHSELTMQWELTVRFTPAGHIKFQQAQRCGTGHTIEISYDRRVLSRPNLAERILGPDVTISGGWSDRASVETLAERLRPRP